MCVKVSWKDFLLEPLSLRREVRTDGEEESLETKSSRLFFFYSQASHSFKSLFSSSNNILHNILYTIICVLTYLSMRYLHNIFLATSEV